MYGWVFRHTIWPIWEWRNHFDILTQLKEYKQIETEDRASMLLRKERMLSDLLWHAYEHVPLYRQRFNEADLTLSEFTLADLAAVPFLSVEDLQTHEDQLTADNATDWRYSYSSGSTGTPKRYKIENTALSYAYASMYRFWGWAGFQLGQRWGHMKSGAMAVSFVKKLKSVVFRVLWMPARLLTDERISEYLKKMRKADLGMLRANPSQVYALADYMLRHEIHDLQIPVIQTHGATLFPKWRAMIEAAFQATVVDGYGAEGMNIAHQCPEETDSYHIAEGVIVETRGNGELILTNLLNYAQPFIRYAIGDIGALAPTTQICPCGREHVLLKGIQGRSSDFMYFRDGSSLSPHFWTHVLSFVKSYAQWQVFQPDYDHIILRAVKSPQYSHHEEEAVYAALRSELKHIPGLFLSIEHVEELPLSPSGKHRYVISEVER